MSNLYNSITKSKLDSMSHAQASILLYGPVKSGVSTAALDYCLQLTGGSSAPDRLLTLAEHTMEELRKLLEQLKFKTSSSDALRVVLIDDADKLVVPAQNILLKIIEEPPRNTIFVVATHRYDQVLVTIRSRLHSVKLLKPNKDQAQAFFGSPAGFDRDWLIADGWVPRYLAVSSGEDGMGRAKNYIGANMTDKLIALNELDSAGLADLLANLAHIAKVSHDIAITKANQEASQIWAGKYRTYVSLNNSLLEGAPYKLIKPALALEVSIS